MHAMTGQPLTDQRSPTVRALLLAVSLLAVAVAAGFVWWLIRHDPNPVTPAASGTPASSTSEQQPTTSPHPATPTQVRAGRFTFTPMAPTRVTSDCAAVAYGQVRDWLADNPCQRVSRGLYATTVGGGAKALVSVIVVTMPSDASASELKGITDTSGTGNVSDMLYDGTVQLPGAPQVAGGAYASELAGDAITIVEGAFYDDYSAPALLDQIAATAIRIGSRQG